MSKSSGLPWNNQVCIYTPSWLALLTRTLGAATTRAAEGAAPTAPTTIPRAVVRAVTGVELGGNQAGCWLDIAGRERWLAAWLRCCKLDPSCWLMVETGAPREHQPD